MSSPLARYRAGDSQAAVTALHEVAKLRKGRDSFDGSFLGRLTHPTGT